MGAHLEVMPHSYTNHTVRSGQVVTKSYLGPDAARRCAREASVLAALAGKLPVLPLIGQSGTTVSMALMPGVHGQELVAAGLTPAVLRACGTMLRRIQTTDARLIAEDAATGAVLVHGDYGPNNVLLDPAAEQVTAIVDWEWAHVGDPVEDLAWCEWIVRMHHPGQAGAIGELFGGYGCRPTWAARHQAMLRKCRYHLSLSKSQETTRGGDGTLRWQKFLSVTRGWSD